MDISALNGTQMLRTKVLKWMCLCLASLSLVFTYFNIFINNFIILGILQGIFFLYCISVYLIISKTQIELWQPLTVCAYVTFLVVFGSYMSDIQHALFIWVLALPVLYYLLLGARWGFIFSALLLVVECAALLAKADIPVFATMNLFLNLTLSFVAIWLVAHVFEKSRESSYKRLENLALLDPLTGVGNRLAMNQFFEIDLKDKQGLFTMVLDLDFFKQVNDRHGHAMGDKLLIEMTNLLLEKLPMGKVFRIGGEEFAIFIPHSSQEKASESAHLIRSSIEAYKFFIDSQAIFITASIGVAKYQAGESLKQTLKSADENLYQAKADGRNQVVIGDLNQHIKLESVC